MLTAGILSFLLLMIQEARHVYVKYLEPTAKYSFRPLFEEADEINDLKYLNTEALESELKELRQKNKEDRKRNRNDEKNIRPDRDDGPERRELQIQQVLSEREQRSLQLHEMHFYWCVGCGFSLIGTLLVWKSSFWIGASSLTFGFSEMIFWTFPSYRVISSAGEYELLLTWKLIYNTISLVLLMLFWIFLLRTGRNSNAITV